MNVPDDWHTYYRTCSRGHRWHASEGGCDACAEMFEEARDDPDFEVPED